MKKLVLIALAFIAIQATAQEQRRQGRDGQERRQKMANLSAEDMATLQTKKMILHLDLNESQQAKIQKINLENAIQRKSMMEDRKAKKESGELKKPTEEERLKMMNAQLDHKIAMKAKMKNILDDAQYTKWEKAQSRMGKKRDGMKRKKKGEGNKK